MGQVLKMVGMGLGAVGVFGGSVAVFLMSRGDLNAEGLSKVPVVGSFFESPEPVDGDDIEAGPGDGGEPAGGTENPESTTGASGDPAATTSTSTSTEGAAVDATTAPAGLFENKDIAGILTDLRAARSAYQNKLAAVEALSERQATEAKEIRDRKQHIESMLEDMQLAQDELTRERARIEQDVVRYSAAEVLNIKKLAKHQEGVEPGKVAAAILEMLNNGDDDGIKILAEMNPRKSSKVLSEFSPEDHARIIRKMKGIVREDPADDGQE